MKIKVLPDEVIGKISAGEVVERPVSVVKELVENSLDAGAKRIGVELNSGGRRLIRVTDDGEGMSAEDALVSVERHSTSKLSSISDLEKISTLGFRGEALASIAAVSRFELVTRDRSSAHAVKISVEGGKNRESEPANGPVGTSVTVSDLFFNVPARRKFLRSVPSEISAIVHLIERFAFCCPDVCFKLIHDQHVILDLAPAKDLEERLGQMRDKDFLDRIVRVEHGDFSMTIAGFISRPDFNLSQRTEQSVFVNSRLVSDRIINRAITQGYEGLVPTGRYPVVLLFIRIDPSVVDVNVHPTKREVRFSDTQMVFQGVVSAISRSLRAGTGMGIVEEIVSVREKPGMQAPESTVPSGIAADLPERTAAAEKTEKVAEPKTEYLIEASPVFLGQARGTYLFAETADGVLIFDQHAAHERYIYENLVAKLERKEKVEKQGLLVPVTLDFPAKDAVIMRESLQEFDMLGFEIEPFGARSFIVRSVPLVLSGKDFRGVLMDLVAEMASLEKTERMSQIRNLIMERLACRAAVKAGDRLTRQEIEKLITHMEGKVRFCPHGRPAFIKITYNELEKRFQRR